VAICHDIIIAIHVAACRQCVELSGEDLWRYSNDIESLGLTKRFRIRLYYDHSLTNIAFLYLAYRSDITVTNSYQSFTNKVAAKINTEREYMYATVILCEGTTVQQFAGPVRVTSRQARPITLQRDMTNGDEERSILCRQC